MTRRRKLLIALGASVVWGPLKAVAQQTGSMPVVGILALGIEDRAVLLREGLYKLGYVEGRNIRVEERDAGDRYARLVRIAEEFVRLKVDVIVALGNTATLEARKATSTIPIVMVSGVDPVKEKLAVSLSRPGGNVTGVTTILHEIVPKRLELAKEAVPGLSQLGILWNPDSRGSTNSLAQAREAATTLKLRLHVVAARSAGDFDRAFDALASAGVKVFVVMTGGMFAANRKELLESAARHRLAGVLSSGDRGESGALISYGPSLSEADQHAAVFVDKILKGAKPGDLPIEQPTKLKLVVNLKTAGALGLAIPQSVLMRADEVIR